jgi:hypothetical protein
VQHPSCRRWRPGPAAHGVVRRHASLAASLLIALSAAACGGSEPYSSFDPAAPCTTDGRFPGAYPALEARLPPTFLARPPDTVDSGRNCSAAELGTLAGHGIREVRFAGASWFLSGNAGLTLAMFTGDGLTAEWLGEWYEATARAARNTRQIDPTRPTVGGTQAYRLDTMNGESVQTIIDWAAPGGDAVYVIVAADAPVSTIEAATTAFPTGH